LLHMTPLHSEAKFSDKLISQALVRTVLVTFTNIYLRMNVRILLRIYAQINHNIQKSQIT
jgi:hypothetical protein